MVLLTFSVLVAACGSDAVNDEPAETATSAPLATGAESALLGQLDRLLDDEPRPDDIEGLVELTVKAVDGEAPKGSQFYWQLFKVTERSGTSAYFFNFENLGCAVPAVRGLLVADEGQVVLLRDEFPDSESLFDVEPAPECGEIINSPVPAGFFDQPMELREVTASSFVLAGADGVEVEFTRAILPPRVP